MKDHDAREPGEKVSRPLLPARRADRRQPVGQSPALLVSVSWAVSYTVGPGDHGLLTQLPYPHLTHPS